MCFASVVYFPSGLTYDHLTAKTIHVCGSGLEKIFAKVNVLLVHDQEEPVGNNRVFGLLKHRHLTLKIIYYTVICYLNNSNSIFIFFVVVQKVRQNYFQASLSLAQHSPIKWPFDENRLKMFLELIIQYYNTTQISDSEISLFYYTL